VLRGAHREAVKEAAVWRDKSGAVYALNVLLELVGVCLTRALDYHLTVLGIALIGTLIAGVAALLIAIVATLFAKGRHSADR